MSNIFNFGWFKSNDDQDANKQTTVTTENFVTNKETNNKETNNKDNKETNSKPLKPSLQKKVSLATVSDNVSDQKKSSKSVTWSDDWSSDDSNDNDNSYKEIPEPPPRPAPYVFPVSSIITDKNISEHAERNTDQSTDQSTTEALEVLDRIISNIEQKTLEQCKNLSFNALELQNIQNMQNEINDFSNSLNNNLSNNIDLMEKGELNPNSNNFSNAFENDSGWSWASTDNPEQEKLNFSFLPDLNPSFSKFEPFATFDDVTMPGLEHTDFNNHDWSFPVTNDPFTNSQDVTWTRNPISFDTNFDVDTNNANDDNNLSSSEEYYIQAKQNIQTDCTYRNPPVSANQNEHVNSFTAENYGQFINSMNDPWAFPSLAEVTNNDQAEDNVDLGSSMDESFTSDGDIDDDCNYENCSTSDESTRYLNVLTEGSLKLIIGPMFSGKSTYALLELARMADTGFDTLYINHADDIRVTEAQDNVVSTHNSQYQTLSKKINSLKVSKLFEVDVSDYQYIAVDEGQFFPDLYENVLIWVTGYGKNVIVASLDGDAYRRKFGQVLDLIPSADKVKKMTALCDICRENERKIKPAPFTARLTKGNSAKVVGGRNLYRAMCRECHDRHLNKMVE